MPEVASDKDLPKLLDTPSKQVKWAKKLITKHLGSTVKRVDRPPMQGMFSRTFFVTLSDDREVVLQFRTEPLDLEAFDVARKALGSVVPEAQALEDEELLTNGAWTYLLSRLPGKMWAYGVAGKGADGRVAITKSLGNIFSKGWLANGSDEAVDRTIRPHIVAILASPLEEVLPYRKHFHDHLEKLEHLKDLPLWVAHYDLNEVNILIDEDCNISGLIDWEMSTPLPFGVGFGRIHTLAGEFTGGEFWVPDEFETAERSFWDKLFEGMPTTTSDMLRKNAALIQDAVILGTLLDCFFLESGKVGYNGIALKALPKLLTYRVPFVRGSNAPYSV